MIDPTRPNTAASVAPLAAESQGSSIVTAVVNVMTTADPDLQPASLQGRVAVQTPQQALIAALRLPPEATQEDIDDMFDAVCKLARRFHLTTGPNPPKEQGVANDLLQKLDVFFDAYSSDQLDLRFVELRALPSNISRLAPRLVELNLYSNNFKKFPIAVSQISSLKVLNLCCNKITTLPTEIGQLSGLEVLNLSNNLITTLPTEMGRLSGLRELNLCCNQLTTLPAEICQLSGLETLYLTDNQIRDLSAEMCKLSSLKKLYLAGNQIRVLPAKIGQLLGLEELNLVYNKITALPAEIGKLSSLETLHLTNNQITILPTEIGQLSSLRTLNLANNRITTLPTERGLLSRLETLNLAGNQIRALPAEIGLLSSLKELDLFYNKITALPAEIGKLSCLKTLNLASNSITTLPIEIGQIQTVFLDQGVQEIYNRYKTLCGLVRSEDVCELIKLMPFDKREDSFVRQHAGGIYICIKLFENVKSSDDGRRAEAITQLQTCLTDPIKYLKELKIVLNNRAVANLIFNTDSLKSSLENMPVEVVGELAKDPDLVVILSPEKIASISKVDLTDAEIAQVRVLFRQKLAVQRSSLEILFQGQIPPRVFENIAPTLLDRADGLPNIMMEIADIFNNLPLSTILKMAKHKCYKQWFKRCFGFLDSAAIKVIVPCFSIKNFCDIFRGEFLTKARPFGCATEEQQKAFCESFTNLEQFDPLDRSVDELLTKRTPLPQDVVVLLTLKNQLSFKIDGRKRYLKQLEELPIIFKSSFEKDFLARQTLTINKLSQLEAMLKEVDTAANASLKSEDEKKELTCPITGMVFRDPVRLVKHGIVVDASVLSGKKCPYCLNENPECVETKNRVCDEALKAQAEAFLNQHPEQ